MHDVTTMPKVATYKRWILPVLMINVIVECCLGVRRISPGSAAGVFCGAAGLGFDLLPLFSISHHGSVRTLNVINLREVDVQE
jgi:hypothetical protein